MITPIRGRKHSSDFCVYVRILLLEMVTPIRGRKLNLRHKNQSLLIRNGNPDKGTETWIRCNIHHLIVY